MGSGCAEVGYVEGVQGVGYGVGVRGGWVCGGGARSRIWVGGAGGWVCGGGARSRIWDGGAGRLGMWRGCKE